MDTIQYAQSQTPCSVGTLIAKTHEQFPILKKFCEEHPCTAKTTDKGFAGKHIEHSLFGRMPNNDSEPDLGDELGDLKVTHAKQFRNLGFNAKERLTITNCGSTNDYSTLQHLVDADCLENNRLYRKLRKGVLVVLQHHGEKWTTMEQFLNTEVVAIFQYDIETLPEEMKSVIRDDYTKIQECVRSQTVSQSGQTYLHIHPHGSKGSKTRALGFTNKFVTRLISHYTNRPLVIKGNSWYISSEQ